MKLLKRALFFLKQKQIYLDTIIENNLIQLSKIFIRGNRLFKTQVKCRK